MQAKQFFIQFIAILFLTAVGNLHAQKIALRADTVFLDGAPYLICKKGDDQKRYEIMAFSGQQLADIHNGRFMIGDNMGYVVTFLNDGKQAMILKKEPFPLSFLNDVAKNNLIGPGGVDAVAEAAYVATHRLPDGYIDVDQIANY